MSPLSSVKSFPQTDVQRTIASYAPMLQEKTRSLQKQRIDQVNSSKSSFCPTEKRRLDDTFVPINRHQGVSYNN
jgi:hypothetical protein